MEIKRAYLPAEKERVRRFLAEQNLQYDADIEFTVYAAEQGNVVGTASAAGNIIKAVAVDPSMQGQNLSALLLDEVLAYFRLQHIYYYQVFTKPKNRAVFTSLNLSEVICTDEVLLLENNSVEGVTAYLQKMRAQVTLPLTDVGVVVANCNPLTNGHLYLMGEAAKRHATVLVFVVEEDASAFPFETRFRLVQQACRRFPNVQVLPSGRYIISSLTFPTYFLKETSSKARAYAKVDAAIFAKYFVPAFCIAKRYVGEEKTDASTAVYNECLKEALGEKLVILPRLQEEGQAVSASVVRKLAKEGDFETVAKLVPPETLQVLKSWKF